MQRDRDEGVDPHDLKRNNAFETCNVIFADLCSAPTCFVLLSALATTHWVRHHFTVPMSKTIRAEQSAFDLCAADTTIRQFIVAEGCTRKNVQRRCKNVALSMKVDDCDFQISRVTFAMWGGQPRTLKPFNFTLTSNIHASQAEFIQFTAMTKSSHVRLH